jgi:hypothetical protein
MSKTVTPASEPAELFEDRKSLDAPKDANGGFKREKSPLRHQHVRPADGTDSLAEVSLDDTEIHARQSSETTDVTLTTINELAPTSVPPELPPRKRGSVSSASSGVSTPPIAGPPPALPARRGPFGWLRSASASSKSPPAVSLPPRSSIASVNYAPATLPNIDLLLARLEEQTKSIKEGDDKIREEYAVGNEELRKSFDRIQKEYQPAEGEDDEIDWGWSLLSFANRRSME